MASSCALHDMSQQVMNDSDIEMGREYGMSATIVHQRRDCSSKT